MGLHPVLNLVTGQRKWRPQRRVIYIILVTTNIWKNKTKKKCKICETGSSWYTGKLLQLRFHKNWKSTEVLIYMVWRVFQTSSAREKMEMRDGNKKSYAKKHIFTSPRKFFTFPKIYPWAKNIQPQLEIDAVGKWSVLGVYYEEFLSQNELSAIFDILKVRAPSCNTK